MGNIVRIPRTYFAFFVTAAMLGGLSLLMTSGLLQAHDGLGAAVTVDLLLTVPLIYLLLIRKSAIPRTTALPVMMLGLLLGSLLMPVGSGQYLAGVRSYVLPLIELTVLAFVILKVRKALRHYRGHRAAQPDFLEALRGACAEILPAPLVLPFTTEIAVAWYAFFRWKKRPLGPNEFSYHRKSGSAALLGGLIFLIGVETVALHFLLGQWSPLAAWVLTGLSLYTALQMFGLARSLSQRPLRIENGRLYLRYGFVIEAIVPLENIESIELSRKPLPRDGRSRKLALLGDLESHNVVIRLHEPQTLTGPYGIKSTFQVLGLYVDDAAAFHQAVKGDA